MKREDLLRSKEFWMVQIQNDLYAAIEKYVKRNGFSRTQLANKLGVSKGYITQVLNGSFDHKISKLVELSLSCDSVPVLHFINIHEYVRNDSQNMTYELFSAPISNEMTYQYEIQNKSKGNSPSKIVFQSNEVSTQQH